MQQYARDLVSREPDYAPPQSHRRADRHRMGSSVLVCIDAVSRHAVSDRMSNGRCQNVGRSIQVKRYRSHLYRRGPAYLHGRDPLAHTMNWSLSPDRDGPARTRQHRSLHYGRLKVYHRAAANNDNWRESALPSGSPARPSST
jgi:hypothetical protein